MARTVEPIQHAARRDSILDAAQALIATRGYEAMTIADVLAATKMSKGAFYHYFASKEALLAGLLTRRVDEWAVAVDEAIRGAGAPADRLRDLVHALSAAKAADRRLLISAMPQLYADANATLNARLRRAAADRFLPRITEVIEDGARSGDFRVASAAAASKVVLSLMQELAEDFARHLMAIAAGGGSVAAAADDVRAYGNAIPAVLGMAFNGDSFIELPDFDDWIRAAGSLSPGSTHSPRAKKDRSR